MKRFAALMLLSGIAFAGPAAAGDFLLGDETKGVTVSSGDADMNIRVRLQPRLDYGDTKINGAYEGEADIYLRRVRLEIGGHLAKDLKYNLTLQGDKWDKAGHGNEVAVLYANAAWKASDMLTLFAGKDKLPYSRVSLTSSSRQLVIERPASTEAAKKLFGESDPYYQPKLAAFGGLAGGVVAYEAAVADGWQTGEEISGGAVETAGPLMAARVEFSPPGWVETKKSDAHLGKGRHLTAGVNYAAQAGIDYGDYEDDITLMGLDLSGHYEGFTAQFEYNTWTTESSDPGEAAVEPNGWYVQAGYFVDGPDIEPVVRYEIYDHDSGSENEDEANATVGLNWYLKGHSMKAGLNWVHTEYGEGLQASPDLQSKDVYQVQAQMYF
jgi:phosphate-selective porin OprO/OprP